MKPRRSKIGHDELVTVDGRRERIRKLRGPKRYAAKTGFIGRPIAPSLHAGPARQATMRRILPEQFDPEQELITLRSIVAREDLVNKLSEAVHACSQNRAWDRKDMLLSLRRMRAASLAVVENIVIWRHSLTKSESFPWHESGENYLVKMSRDLDFMRALPLPKMYGFHLAAKNPFALPLKFIPQDHQVISEEVTPETHLRILEVLYLMSRGSKDELDRLERATKVLQSELERSGASSFELNSEWALKQWTPKDARFQCTEYLRQKKRERHRLKAVAKSIISMDQLARLHKRETDTESLKSSMTDKESIDTLLGDLRIPLEERLPELDVTTRMRGIPSTQEAIALAAAQKRARQEPASPESSTTSKSKWSLLRDMSSSFIDSWDHTIPTKRTPLPAEPYSERPKSKSDRKLRRANTQPAESTVPSTSERKLRRANSQPTPADPKGVSSPGKKLRRTNSSSDAPQSPERKLGRSKTQPVLEVAGPPSSEQKLRRADSAPKKKKTTKGNASPASNSGKQQKQKQKAPSISGDGTGAQRESSGSFDASVDILSPV